MKQLLTPRELAEAIGVSESSLKRWTDEGRLRASRTAGGHRRIPVAEAIRFVRESQSTVVRPEILGMAEIAEAQRDAARAGGDEEQLREYLKAGRGRQARGLILGLYLRGQSVAAICDGPIQAAMEEIGDLWQHSEEGILVEHRATDICVQALNQLRLGFVVPEDAPVAVGGAPADDPYMLPSLMAATVLAAEGFQTVNLGANTPFDTLLRAARAHRALLVWLSVSHASRRAQLDRELEDLARPLAEENIGLVLGGRGIPPTVAARSQVGNSMAELVGFAKGLAQARGSDRPS